MNLLIDIGNTRLKWAVGNQFELVAKPPITNITINRANLTQLWQVITPPKQIAISCVSSNKLFNLVVSVIVELWPRVTITRAKSEAAAYGVCNAYKEPEQLGVDRWLGLIAGYHNYRKPLCIVDCGTAITVDVVNASGKHLGGLISPGLMLMKESLKKGTENLKPNHDVYSFGLACFTNAAIHNGTLSAACGLIERTLKNHPDPLQLILTGGDAKMIADHLSYPAILDPDLVLHGLNLTLNQPT